MTSSPQIITLLGSARGCRFLQQERTISLNCRLLLFLKLSISEKENYEENENDKSITKSPTGEHELCCSTLVAPFRIFFKQMYKIKPHETSKCNGASKKWQQTCKDWNLLHHHQVSHNLHDPEQVSWNTLHPNTPSPSFLWAHYIVPCISCTKVRAPLNCQKVRTLKLNQLQSLTRLLIKFKF